MKRAIFLMAAAAMITGFGLVNAQIDLSYLSASTVRNAWGYTRVKIDSLHLETEAGSGIVKSSLTLCLTPQEAHHYYGTQNTSTSQTLLDSLEISLHFRMPPDFAATDMFLWIEGEKVRAFLQDRSLARAQYESIVKRRRDPALFEYYGSGSYSLRIFPCKSFETRKIELQFVHSLYDSSNSVHCIFPIRFKPYSSYYYSSNYGDLMERINHIGYVKVQASALDDRSYSCLAEGMGQIDFNKANAAVLEKKNADSLGPCLIRLKDSRTSGDPFCWQSKERYGRGAFGFSLMLDGKSLNLEPEPKARIFVMDIRGKKGETLLRAKKLAVLAIKNYVKSGQGFNVVVSGAHLESSQILFKDPQSPSEENLIKAFSYIIGIETNSGGSTEAGIRAGIEAMGANRDGLMVLLSDDSIGYDKAQALGEMLKNNNVLLFGYFDDWSLSSLAYLSGGYKLGSLSRGPTWYRGNEAPSSMQGEVVTLALESGREIDFYFPPLFGGDLYYYPAITDVKVKKLSGDVLDYAFVFESPYWYYYALAKASRKKSDWAMRITPFKLAIAGLVEKSTEALFEISGKYCRREFHNTYAVSVDRNGEIAESGDALYGLFKSECEWREQTQSRQDSAGIWGKAYHVLTRGTSLLALEPGIELWEEMPMTESENANTTTSANLRVTVASSSQASGVSSDALTVADYLYAENYESPLDSISLEKIMAMEISEEVEPEAQGSSPIQFRLVPMSKSGYRLDVQVQASFAQQRIELKIFDAAGRCIHAESKPATGENVTFVLNQKNAGKRPICPGRYFVVFKMAGFSLQSKMAIRSR